MKVILLSEAAVLVNAGLSVLPLNFWAEAVVVDIENANVMAANANMILFICLCVLILITQIANVSIFVVNDSNEKLILPSSHISTLQISSKVFNLISRGLSQSSAVSSCQVI